MIRICCWIVLAALSLPAEAMAALQPFAAEYDVFEDGDRIGRAQLELREIGPRRWRFSTTTEGEGGMAGMVGARIEEVSELLEQDDGQLATTGYAYRQKVAWRTRERSLRVDPGSQQIAERDGKRNWNYQSGGLVLDRHALVLALAGDLAATGAPGVHRVAHKGEVEEWRFAAGGKERVTTNLGDLVAVRLERIRENRERKTVSWHAPDWKFLPVVIEQVEPDGSRYRMQLLRWTQAP